MVTLEKFSIWCLVPCALSHSFRVCLTCVNPLLCSSAVFTDLPGVRQLLQHMLLQKLCCLWTLQAGSHNSKSSILLWCKAWALPWHLQSCICWGLTSFSVQGTKSLPVDFSFQVRVVPQAGRFCWNVAASGSHFGNQPFIQFSTSKTQEVKWLQAQSWWIRLVYISRWSSFSPLATRCYRTRQERVSSINGVLPISSYVTDNDLCIKIL